MLVSPAKKCTASSFLRGESRKGVHVVVTAVVMIAAHKPFVTNHVLSSITLENLVEVKEEEQMKEEVETP